MGNRQIKVVERIASRMLQRNIEGLEIVILVLDFRSVGGRKTEPAHDVLQFFDRLCDRMQTTQPQALTRKRGVKLRTTCFLNTAGRESFLCGGESRLNGSLHLIEPLPGCRFIFLGYGT